MNASVSVPWSAPTEGLPLTVPTPGEWLPVVQSDLNALLVDHAHCEQKAASMALSLIGRFADNGEMVRAMVALAAEEMHHFRQVLDKIESRGARLTAPLPDPYVHGLRDWSFRHPGGLGARVDLLLVCAFVEARSCERFRILAQALAPSDDAATRELGVFYLRLADAEARHWETFRTYAQEYAGESAVIDRIAAMAEAEGELVLRGPVSARMH